MAHEWYILWSSSCFRFGQQIYIFQQFILLHLQRVLVSLTLKILEESMRIYMLIYVKFVSYNDPWGLIQNEGSAWLKIQENRSRVIGQKSPASKTLKWPEYFLKGNSWFRYETKALRSINICFGIIFNVKRATNYLVTRSDPL